MRGFIDKYSNNINLICFGFQYELGKEYIKNIINSKRIRL